MPRKIKRRKKSIKLFDQINLEHLEEELYQPITSFRVLIGIVIIAFFLIGSVWQKVNVTQLAQDIEQLNAQKLLIEEKNAELRSRILKLADGKRIIQIAEDNLKLTFPDSELLPLKQKFQKSDFDDLKN
jgi:cell division protein FtsL